MRKKLLALLLALAMVVSMLSLTAMAAGFADTGSHWGKDAINRWAGYGVLDGYGDGNFGPEDQMTRAQFAAMLVKLMGYTDAAPMGTFTDVSASDWFASDILKLYQAGVMNGRGNGMVDPNGYISREDAAVMLCRALKIPASSSSIGFSDAGNVSSYARGYVAALEERGMLNGNGDGTVTPLASINRASVASLVSQMVSEYVVEDGATVTGVKDKIVIIKADNVKIEDATLTQPVIVAPAAKDAKVSLTGTTTAAEVVVNAEGAKVEVSETASAKNVEVAAKNAGADIAGKVDTVTVDSTATNANVTVEKTGEVKDVDVQAKGTDVEVSGKVENVVVSSSGSADVKAEAGAKVDNVTAAGDTTVTGAAGTVGNVTATGSADVDVKAPDAKVENNGAGKVTDNGKDVPPSNPSEPSNPSNPGTGTNPGTGPSTDPGTTPSTETDTTFTVIPAPLVGQGTSDTLATDYKVSETKAELTYGDTASIKVTSTNSGAAYAVNVTLQAKNIKSHTAVPATGTGTAGYWVGIGIKNPFEDYTVSGYSQTGSTTVTEGLPDGETDDGYSTFYFDVFKTETALTTGKIVATYTSTTKTPATITVTYTITFDVSKYTDGGQGQTGDFPGFDATALTAATLADRSDSPKTGDDLVQGYSVTGAKTNATTYTATVKTTFLAEHKNADGDTGRWVGVKVPAVVTDSTITWTLKTYNGNTPKATDYTGDGNAKCFNMYYNVDHETNGKNDRTLTLVYGCSDNTKSDATVTITVKLNEVVTGNENANAFPDNYLTTDNVKALAGDGLGTLNITSVTPGGSGNNRTCAVATTGQYTTKTGQVKVTGSGSDGYFIDTNVEEYKGQYVGVSFKIPSGYTVTGLKRNDQVMTGKTDAEASHPEYFETVTGYVYVFFKYADNNQGKQTATLTYTPSGNTGGESTTVIFTFDFSALTGGSN